MIPFSQVRKFLHFLMESVFCESEKGSNFEKIKYKPISS